MSLATAIGLIVGAMTLLVHFDFINGDYLGQYPVTAGGHMAVVDGFTHEGPFVVTWGQTLQMTWQQWNAEATGTWGWLRERNRATASRSASTRRSEPSAYLG